MARSASGRSAAAPAPVAAATPPVGDGSSWPDPNTRLWLVIGFVVRRRAELTVITVVWLVLVQLDSHVTPGLPGWMTPAQWAWLLMAATVAVVLAVPASRRYTLRRCTAVVMRHRMRACFLQTRTWTANGRLPFLMWSRPTRVGVRVRVWLPAGLSVNDLERIIDELGTACWAREARITPVRGQAALVWSTSSAATPWAPSVRCPHPWSTTSTRTVAPLAADTRGLRTPATPATPGTDGGTATGHQRPARRGRNTAAKQRRPRRAPPAVLRPIRRV